MNYISCDLWLALERSKYQLFSKVEFVNKT